MLERPHERWLSDLLHVDLRGILLLGTGLLILEVPWGSAGNIYTAVRQMRLLTPLSAL
ncbi:MAG: hypothetical protein KAY32_09370 [Candidatus Eisenbacteria sp.]|nr:hypothetical protein [Candidatus Eisenbacteria bacterium]